MSTVTGTWKLHRTGGARATSRTWPPRDRLAVAAGLAAPFLVALVLVPFRASLSHTNAALVLVVVVVAVASLGSRVAGVVAALSAAAWFDFFLTRPYETFDIEASADIETAVLLLAVGLIVSQLAARARRLEVITVTDAGYWRGSTPRPPSPSPPGPRTPSSTTSGTNSPNCSACAPAASSTAPSWDGRHACRTTAVSRSAGAPGTWTPPAGPRARSKCAPTATATTSAASCSLPVRAPYPHSRPGWWR